MRPTTDHRVIVIGSGFAGIAMGIKLKEAGVNDFVILEKDDDLGGTWRDNTYPGCACDIPSYLYSYSFEPNPGWSRMFSPQDEIWDYLRHCVDTYGLAPHLRYGAEVTSATYDESAAAWTVQTGSGDVLTAQVVTAGVGALHQPNYPDLPGLETFRGTTFHSADWDHDHDLAGERVAVIGTGASSIQFVPKIAPKAAHVDVYQRHAPWVTPKPDRRIGAQERAWHTKFPIGQKAIRSLVFWGLEARGVGFAISPRLMKGLEVQARRHLEKQVPDPDLRARLTPDYQIGCKRILISNDYYPTLNRDDVDLVTDGIREVTATGVVTTDGTERSADTIIFGTGFEVSGNLTRMKIVGREGVELNERWERQGIGAHLGITMSGFPNLFLLVGPNTGLGHNSMVFMIEQQVAYVVQALKTMDRRGADWIEVRERPQRRFVDRVQTRLSDSVWSSCQSWYLDENGRNFTIWPHFTWQYWLATRRLRTRDFALGNARTPA